MSETAKLLKVFLIDKQLSGLTSRLRAAERFLTEQEQQISQLDTRKRTAESQIKQLGVTIANHEGEMARLDARMEQLREQMNLAKTNREYKAFLTEINTIKADRSKIETIALELMAQADGLRGQIAEIDTSHAERTKLRTVAEDDRAKRAEEIRDRLTELNAERARVIDEVPESVAKLYQALYSKRDEEAMAPVEVQDRKRHEFTCGSCMMSIPVEIVNRLMTHGTLTRCVSCQCILYMDQTATDAMQPPSKPAGKSTKKQSAKG
jgi:predicted  nucleic acid-binding Zn-ribbon protein